MSQTRPLVFVLEDDRDLAAILQRTLETYGFDAESFDRALKFEQRLTQVRPDLCVVDMCLPDGPGLNVIARQLKSDAIPSIIISGVWTDVSDRVEALEVGADDYLLKPFSPRELVARVRAVLRRAAPVASRRVEIARFAGWTAEFHAYRLIAPDNREIELSASETRLLRVLVSHPQRVLTRETLMEDTAAAGALAFDRSIDVRISRLRTKLGEDPRNPRMIKTIYGAGYMFTAMVEWSSG
jgi:DNA-binding response OmpR family regulator